MLAGDAEVNQNERNMRVQCEDADLLADPLPLHCPIMRIAIYRRAVAPIEIVAIKLRLTAAKLFQADVRPISLARHIVFQRAPRQRIEVNIGLEKSTALYYRVSDGSGLLLEHEPLDRANPLSVATVDRCSLHAITGNQGMCHDNLPAFPVVKISHPP